MWCINFELTSNWVATHKRDAPYIQLLIVWQWSTCYLCIFGTGGRLLRYASLFGSHPVIIHTTSLAFTMEVCCKMMILEDKFLRFEGWDSWRGCSVLFGLQIWWSPNRTGLGSWPKVIWIVSDHLILLALPVLRQWYYCV